MKALVIVDMQNDFIDGSLGSPEAQAVVPKMVKRMEELANQQDTYLIFTQDTHYEDYLETQEGRNLPVPHCIINTPGWEINKEIADAAERFNFVIDVENNSATRVLKDTFGSTELGAILSTKADYFNEIILMGVCTDICVVSNALLLKAFMPEMKITVDASCCAGVTPEKHKAALETMRSCQINVIND